MKNVTLHNIDGTTLKVTKEQAERMLRIQRNMRGRSYSLPQNLELVDGIIRKKNQGADRAQAEQETTGCSDQA